MRHALRRDLPDIVDLWVDAFARDPFLRWMQPGDVAWPAFGGAWLGFVADLVFERGHTYLSDRGDVAAAWVPPDVALVGADDLTRGRSIIAAHAGEDRAADAFDTIMRARGQAADEPHWTLQYIGVRPSQQARGLGVAAVAPMVTVCDLEGLACELVSSNPRNVPFYERLGFTVAAEVVTPDGTATLRPMRRPPR